jgi:hypothetical protein
MIDASTSIECIEYSVWELILGRLEVSESKPIAVPSLPLEPNKRADRNLVILVILNIQRIE